MNPWISKIALGRGLVDILVDLLVVEAESIATIKTDTKSSETEVSPRLSSEPLRLVTRSFVVAVGQGDVSSASFYLLLALHRQFQRSCPDGDFTVLDTVAEAPHTTHTVLVEKLICLFNREGLTAVFTSHPFVVLLFCFFQLRVVVAVAVQPIR